MRRSSIGYLPGPVSLRRSIVGPVSNRRGGVELPPGLLSVVLLLYAIGVVALFSSGRANLQGAITLLALPVAAAVALIRPEWLLIGIVLLPPGVTTRVPAMQFVAVLVVALFGFLFNDRLHLGLKTGMFPLLGIIAFALATKADVSADALGAADTVMKNLISYSVMMLVAFQATANDRLSIDRFIDALIWGIVIAAIVQPFLPSITVVDSVARNPYAGPFANLAMVGFGVTYIRRSLATSVNKDPSPVDALLMAIFLALTIISYNRAAFIGAILCFALVSRWTGRKMFWIVLALVLALTLTIPVVRDAIAPGGSIDVSNQQTLQRVTSGRSFLWEDLWQRGVEALPLGNGWGYTWSLSSTQIFGFAGVFSNHEGGVVFPHNDFLFLFVELGVVGVGLIVVFWIQLVRRFRFLSRFWDPLIRYEARVLAPLFVIMFLLQLFANGLSLRFVADRFFIGAGLLFGLYCLARDTSGQLEPAHERRWG